MVLDGRKVQPGCALKRPQGRAPVVLVNSTSEFGINDSPAVGINREFVLRELPALYLHLTASHSRCGWHAWHAVGFGCLICSGRIEHRQRERNWCRSMWSRNWRSVSSANGRIRNPQST